jgi:hypothetical protein
MRMLAATRRENRKVRHRLAARSAELVTPGGQWFGRGP